MSRLYVHDIESAPIQARPHLTQYIETSPTGKILNLHGAMAHAPIVLEMYARMRSTVEEYGELDGRALWAAMLAVATIHQSAYSANLYAGLGRRYGLTEEQIRAITQGGRAGDNAIDALIAVAREAVSNHGRVTVQVWNEAVATGWSDRQLGELFAALGLALFVDYFVNYSEVENDLPRLVEV